MDLESLVKNSRIAKWAYHNLSGLYPLGTWLYRQSVLEWVTRPWARSQLPPAFRAFSRFCELQSWLPGRVWGGATAFRVASRLYETGRRGPLSLQIDGHTIHLNPRDPRMLQVPRELQGLLGDDSVLGRFLEPGDTFVDIGANHGAYSVAAARFVGPEGTVLAFEPQPGLHPLVDRSLEAGDVHRFRVFPDACSDQPGEAEFFVPTKSSGRAGMFAQFSANSSHKKTRVRLVRVDDVTAHLELTGEVFVKLDVEGNELAVLRGAEEFIRTHRPRLLMEINPIAMKAAGTDHAELLEELHRLGWRSFRRLDDLETRRPLEDLSSDWLENVVFDFVPPD